ncbi:MAG: hypothetical protein J6Y08_09335 [Clostridiales bacterium]|nr:hypothetical protein [Clostridiales bacterium]
MQVLLMAKNDLYKYLFIAVGALYLGYHVAMVFVKGKYSQINNRFHPSKFLGNRGFRDVTREEHEVVLQTIPSRLKMHLAAYLVLILVFAFFPAGVAVYSFIAKKIMSGILTSVVAVAILIISIAPVSVFLERYKDLKNRTYTVARGKIVEKATYIKVSSNRRSSTAYRVYRVIVKDDHGGEDFFSVSKKQYNKIYEGDDCLVVRFSREDKINPNKIDMNRETERQFVHLG